MTAKAKRSKRYHYSSNLVSAFLRDVVPEQGGHYVVCTARLETQGDVVWAGHRAFPVLVRNRKLKALILLPCDGVPIHGSMLPVVHMTVGCREGIQEFHLKPIEQRTTRWDWRTKENHSGIDYTPIIVDRLSEDLADCDLATLQRLAGDRVTRIMAGVPSNRWQSPGRFCHALTGAYRYYGTNALQEALGLVSERFSQLGFEWNEEWSRIALIASAKRKLTAS
jgi:hypothetical protein